MNAWASRVVGLLALWLHAAAPAAPPASPPEQVPALTYADMADLANGARQVVVARIRQQAEVPAERAPGLAPGKLRLYVEARPSALLAGPGPLPARLRYVVDVAPTPKGKPPKLSGQTVILFGRPVAGHPEDLQLVRPDAQLVWSDALAQRLQPVLDAFLAPDAPPAITGIRDVLWVPGNLTGESETQLFLATATGDPALISVIRQPGAEPHWGVSWSELVDPAARPPQHDTALWYRLACFLPPRLPSAAQLSADAAARARAQEDYRLVLRDLGPCPRTRR